MRQRYEEEIEEILKNAGEPGPDGAGRQPEQPGDDRPPTPPRRAVSRPRPAPAANTGAGLPRVTPSRVLVAGLALLLLAVLLKISPLVWLGLAMVAIGYVAYFMRPRTARRTQYWRGQPVDTAPESAWERFKRWFGG